MATHVIKMPDLGEGIAEVELVAWRVAPGDMVAEDQILADVMTDKATVEIPSSVAGKVLALGGEVGQVMAVGSELIRLEVTGEGAAAESSPVEAPRQTPAKSASAAQGQLARSSPARTPAPGTPLQAHAGARASSDSAARPIASPAVRRRAWELGVDLAQVPASGPAGRIMHADLAAWAARAAPVAPSRVQAQAQAQVKRDGTQQVQVVGLRRRIAQRMQEAKRHIPHFTYVEEVDVTELEALRATLNARYGAGRAHLTILPFIVRALVVALPDFPEINAHFDDEHGIITRHSPVHAGIATQTDAGLLVPVLRHAEAVDLWSCALEVARLADLARTGKATRDELSGSTITITSLGRLGGIVTTPIVNRPEVAIIGVNRIVERPVMQGGAVAGRQMMNLSSSFDHRVVDGHQAARFVQALRSLLECPATLFVA